MAPIDFTTATTEDLLQIIPETETREWEFKAADIFQKGRFGEFKSQKLGRIVSSFANSGGGFLLLGKRDGCAAFDGVPLQQGRTRMEDHLALVISQSVEPHYRDFAIFRVPVAETARDSVLVVAFDDSMAAPHQSVADVNYYYRLPGHCVPAPHFHLELLRDRYTKAVVELGEPTYSVSLPLLPSKLHPNQIRFLVTVRIELRNVSSQIAHPCAIRVFCDDPEMPWFLEGDQVHLATGTVIENKGLTLFPTLSVPFTVTLSAFISKSRDDLGWRDLLPHWEALRICLQPFSQDFAGDVTTIRPAESVPVDQLADAVDRHKDELEQFRKQAGEIAKRFAGQEGLSGRSRFPFA